MTDQERLPDPRTLISSLDKIAKVSSTRIESITNGKGEPIDNGGVTDNSDLSFVGSAQPSQYAQILDHGVGTHPAVWVDENGHFSAFLPNETSGEHAYTVQTMDGHKSDVWRVFIGKATEADIDSVNDSNGNLIERGGFTWDTELNFVGFGVSHTKVKLYDNGNYLQTLNVDGNRHWSALVQDLVTGLHQFTVLGPDGILSRPWVTEVKESAPLAIQFVIDSNFKLLGNHEKTKATTVTFVGTANPNEKGFLADYDNDVASIQADSNGVFIVTAHDLAKKVHTFRIRTYENRVSAPWIVRVVAF
ncbi:hypothetical protein ACIP1X_07680 [Pseudomonas sp. NPDC088885]|uniref:hypothetical protein n=1 Tax=Pseudomonas sp. NPDC088885 TaxID=3364457 RepID=UPI00382D31AC